MVPDDFSSYQLICGALAAIPAFAGLDRYLGWLIVLAGAAVTATLEEAFRAASPRA